jgi:ATP:cob(I)alamin adenosyltransferase
MDGTYYEDERACHPSVIEHRRRGSIGVAGGDAGGSNSIEDDASRTTSGSTVDDARGGGGGDERRNASIRGEVGSGSATLGTLTTKNVPYTRKGDAGTSQLFTGERRSKDDVLFEALGTIDELCSIVGVVYAELNTSRAEKQRRLRRSSDDDVDELKKIIAPVTSPYGNLPEQLLDVMSRLFDVGSHIACPPSPRIRLDHSSPTEGASNDGGGFNPRHTAVLEGWIDSMTEELPELLSFIIPTGSPASTQLHVARTVCRRAERRMVPLVHDHDGNVDPVALAYVNRLSDYLFTAARYVNYCDGNDEVQYKVEMKVPGDANGEGGANFHSRERVVVKLKK